MSAPRPTPKRLPNVVIHLRAHRLCDDMSMVICPASDHGVEQIDRGFLRHCAAVPDGFPDLIQERFHVLGSWIDHDPATLFRTFCPRKSKPSEIGEMLLL